MNVSSQYQIRGKSGNQIAANIEEAIRNGRVAAGARLPAIRSLAQNLKVSPTTIAAAYQTLRVRGLLHGSGRRGTIVNRRPPLTTPSMPQLPAGVRNLMAGNPDARLLPSLREVVRRIVCASPLYGGVTDSAALLELARRHFKADGIEAQSLTLVSGAMDAIERVLQAHLSPGDLVGVEDPSYRGTLDLISALGLVAEPIAIDDFGPTPQAMARALQAGVSAVIVTPRGQNPTGSALDRKRAAALVEVLARKPDVLVIEDDFTGPISGVPAFTLTGGRERWAVARSVSKALGPDLRLAIIAGDRLTMARVEGRQRLGPRWISQILQEMVVAMWSDAKITRLVRRAAETYTARRQALIDALAKFGIEGHGRSGLNVWVPVVEETATVQALLNAGWAVLAGESFRLKTGPGIRVMTATLEIEEAPRLAGDIAAALRPRTATHIV
ncbi:MAG TPA: aminotransferase class I/II-fold pyridoxal phosphate-dependent enzyme [Candidatus Binataceae bacterium]|nr:aminotransferase class I/II-fold pyridoxal phosphate-dependent enzyme [Candidatus Binataceae bacterium]